MEEIIKIVENVDAQTLVGYIIAIPLVVKGITTKFNVVSGVHRELIALLVSLGAFINIVFGHVGIVMILGLFVKLYFGATGIYNFIPEVIKNPDKVEEQKEKELEVSEVVVLPPPTDENFEAEFGENSDGSLG